MNLQTRWLPYWVSVASVVLAILIRWLLDPLLGNSLQLLTLYGAVAVSVWFGGWKPGTLAALLAFLAADYFFVPPRYVWEFNWPVVATFVGYSISCGIIIYFGDRMRRANARLETESRGRAAIGLGLAQQKELLATTLASIGDGVIVTDNVGRVTFLNAEAEGLTGWKAAEAAGQPLSTVFRIINEVSRQPVESPVEKSLRLGTVVGLANHTLLLSKDGREIPVADSAAPIRDAGGGPVFGVVLVFRDATEERKAQEVQ